MDTLVLSDFNQASKAQEAVQISSANKKQVVNLNIKLGLGLAIVLIVGLVLFFWAPWKANIYQDYKISKEMIIQQLAKSPDEDFRAAGAYFEKDFYYETRQIVSKRYLQDLSNTAVAKQYALILIATDCLETSKQVLYPIFESKDQKDKAEAAYLLGLTFLKEGKNMASKQWFNKVSNGSPQYQDAQDIIARLEML